MSQQECIKNFMFIFKYIRKNTNDQNKLSFTMC